MKNFLSLKREEMTKLRKEYIEGTKTGKAAIVIKFIFYLSLIAFAIIILFKLYIVAAIVFATGFFLNLAYSLIDEYVFFKKWLLTKGFKR